MSKSPHPEAQGAETASILNKAFELLYAFNGQNRVMTLSQLSRASGLPKSTVHRLLARLVALGALEHHRSGYRLGLGLMQLGATTPAANMRDLAIPYLVSVQRWSGMTVTCAVLRDFDTVYIEHLSPLDSAGQLARVGGRLPANCTAIGKALLAHEDLDDLAAFLPNRLPRLTQNSITDPDEFVDHLRTVIKEGVAREQEEAHLGLASIAMPIIVNGFAVASVAMTGPADTPIGHRVEDALRATVKQIALKASEFIATGRDNERLLPRTVTDPAPWSMQH